MTVDYLVRLVVDLSRLETERKGVTVTGESHGIVEEEEYSVVEPELLIVALVSPRLVCVFLKCLFLAALA